MRSMAMSVRRVTSGYERGKYTPVQAYVDKGVLARFRQMYGTHGDITQIIRNAFAIAINEDVATQKTIEARTAHLLPDVPASETVTIPCTDCDYPMICRDEKQCTLREFYRSTSLRPPGVDTSDENG